MLVLFLVTQSCLTLLWPRGLKPTRLLCPWDFPGKITGVGCHFLLQCMKVKSESEVAQSCPTLSDPMDYSLPGSSVHRIFQARVLEWGAIGFIGDWNAKVWSQETPEVTGKFGLGIQSEAGQRLIEFCQENALVIANTLFPTTQENTLHMDITRWSTPKSNWFCSLQPKLEKLYTVNKNKTRSWLWLRSWMPYYPIQT